MYLQGQNGLMATWREGFRSRALSAWIIAALMVGFYIDLYWFDHFQPLAEAVGLRNKWYLYGALYCLFMVGGAVYHLRRHGNSRYNQARIATNVGVQVLLAFLLPFVMPLFGGKEFYFSYFWPLKYDLLLPDTIWQLPLYLAIYGLVGSLLLAPVMAFFFGKRWYCSWVCGCGGLANTYGDPWRHLTSTSTRAWRFEQVAIHVVLGLVVFMTGVMGIKALIGHDHPGFVVFADHTKSFYGFLVGSVLSGVVGTGLYPLLGPRVWCRNFCPMAALLGLVQKLGRFRIAVKDDMCISCGNCSAYCEMGIDVRSYAQSNQSFTRAACVGCGMCAHVCPRGVLRLENRFDAQGDKDKQHIVVLDF
ncbi:MAG: 4Fe-4S binding protein [Alphaproteobacteria bacterium]|nr:4Fe-4S binding protein [Alphaproteobacteria bacterium]